MRRYIPAIVVVGLFVLGIIGCVCYAIQADANCPVETKPDRPTDLGQIYRDNSKRYASRNTNHATSQNERGTPPRSVVFAIVQAAAEQTESDTHTGDNEAKHPRWLTKAFCDTKLADIALAYFAYGLIIVTGYLVWATLKLWTATIEADRPWVGTVTVSPDKERNPFGAEIVIRNTGRTPALQMRVAHRGDLLAQSAVPAIPDPRNEISKALFPHADDYYYPLHGHAPFTAAELEGFETGTHVLWLIARVEYLDGWGKFHHTNICARWDRGRGTFVPDQHNDAN